MDGQPSPMAFLQALSGYQTTGALRGALDLSLFTRIGEGHDRVETLAAATGASRKGVRVLADYFTVLGFLRKTGIGDDATYTLTQDAAAFLDRRSPAYLGDCANFLASPALYTAFDSMAEVARRGHTLLPGAGSVEPENPMWVDFARGMMGLMFPPAQAIAGLLEPVLPAGARILDIAAGHGLFGIMVAQRVKDARITAVDWKAVLAVARENAARFGVADRHDELPGNAFDVDYGTGYDAVLLTNFLHHFDASTCETLLRRVHAALKPGGRAVILEFVPDDDRVNPPMPATFALVMMASTRDGDAYTYAELSAMCRNAGFASTERHAAGPSPQTIIVAVK